MAKSYRFGMVETEAINMIYDHEMRADKIPKLGDIVEGAAYIRNMEDEIGVVGKFQRANGFMKNRSMQRIAKFDTVDIVTLDHLHEAGCTCSRSLWGSGGHKAWLLAFLQTDAGKPFDTRASIIV